MIKFDFTISFLVNLYALEIHEIFTRHISQKEITTESLYHIHVIGATKSCFDLWQKLVELRGRTRRRFLGLASFDLIWLEFKTVDALEKCKFWAKKFYSR